MTQEQTVPQTLSVQTENCAFKIKQLNHGLYRFYFGTEKRNGRPTCKFGRVITVGKNKGGLKVIENYWHKDIAAVESYVANKIKQIDAREESRKQEAEKKAALKNELTGNLEQYVGTVFYSSWGYDQTNVDFYQIIGATKSSLKFRKISKTGVPGTDGMMCNRVIPVDDDFIDEEIHTRVPRMCSYGGNSYLTMSFGHHSLSPYDGGADGVYCSWYA